MGRDDYDDRDEYQADVGAHSGARRAGGRDMQRQERAAGGSGRRDAMGGGKSRSSHNWPPRSKYRIRPWG